MGLTHATPGEVVKLLPAELDPAKTRTHALVKTEDFEAVRLCVHAGQEIPEHKTKGPITVQCLTGKAIFNVAGTDHELAPGDWLFLEREQRHAVRGIEDSVLLITIIFI